MTRIFCLFGLFLLGSRSFRFGGRAFFFVDLEFSSEGCLRGVTVLPPTVRLRVFTSFDRDRVETDEVIESERVLAPVVVGGSEVRRSRKRNRVAIESR